VILINLTLNLLFILGGINSYAQDYFGDLEFNLRENGKEKKNVLLRRYNVHIMC